MIALVAVVGLLLGVVVGFSTGRGSDDTAADTADVADTVPTTVMTPVGNTRAFVAGGGDLTQRQLQMLDVVDDYAAALRANDVDAVIGLYHEVGAMSLFGDVRVDNGTLAAHLREFPDVYSDFDPIEPMMIDTHRVVFFDKSFGLNMIEFSSSGPVQITYHGTYQGGSYSTGGTG